MFPGMCFLLGNFRMPNYSNTSSSVCYRGGFPLSPFRFFILPGHPRPCADISSVRIIHVAHRGRPIHRSFAAWMICSRWLIHSRVYLFEIGFQRPLNGQLRIDGCARPTCASQSLNGSALGEGIDWMIRRSRFRYRPHRYCSFFHQFDNLSATDLHSSFRSFA